MSDFRHGPRHREHAQVERRFLQELPRLSLGELKREFQVAGCDVSGGRDKDGEMRQQVRFPSGLYKMDVGFQGFDPNDTRRFYGNNPPNLQARPIEIDGGTSVKKFFSLVEKEAGKSHAQGRGSSRDRLEGIIDTIDAVLQDNLQSREETEQVSRLSEILDQGWTACAGMVLVAGLSLERIKGDLPLRVEEVRGVSHRVADQRLHDVNHVWLRVSNGSEVILYDPYYGRRSTYELASTELTPDDPFRLYTVQAEGAGVIINKLNAQKLESSVEDRTRLVRNVKGGYEAYLSDEHSFLAQVRGSQEVIFQTSGGEMEFMNGTIERSRDPRSNTAGRMLSPVLGIEKIR
jgi:hypothetical protein